MMTATTELLNSILQLGSLSSSYKQFSDVAQTGVQHGEDVSTLIIDSLLEEICQDCAPLDGCAQNLTGPPLKLPHCSQASAMTSPAPSAWSADIISAILGKAKATELIPEPGNVSKTPYLSSSEPSRGSALQGHGLQPVGTEHFAQSLENIHQSKQQQRVSQQQQHQHHQHPPEGSVRQSCSWQQTLQQQLGPTGREQSNHHAGRDSAEGTTANRAAETAQQQSNKRGRPPKTPGVFSKGYMAIKRYRQRRKGMVEQMEQEVEAKREELLRLEKQNAQLRLLQGVLEAAVAAVDAVLAELPQLRQFMDIMPPSSSVSDNSILPAPAAAALEEALGSEGLCSGTGAAAAAAECASALLHVAAELQKARQIVQLHRVQISDVALDCYKAYVADSALQLAQDVSAALPNAPAAVAAAAATGVSSGLSATSFPAFPLGPVQASLLWDPAKTGTIVQLPVPAGVKQLPDGLSLLSLNLETGLFDLVDNGFWQQVAGQLKLLPEQQQRMEVAWTLFAAAHDRLDQQRHQVQQHMRLQGEGCSTPGSAAVAASGGAEGWLKLACAVEQYMLTARVVVIAHNWCLKGILGDEQFAKLCIACWPYYGVPHIRVVVGHLLGKG